MALLWREEPFFLTAVLVLIAVFSVASPTRAGKPVKSFGKNRAVQAEDFLPHLSSRENYSETWSHGVFDDSGNFILGFNFVITNFGIGDHEGAVTTELISSSGKRITCKKEYDENWSADKEPFELKFGENRLTRIDGGFKTSIKCKKIKMELLFKSDAKPVKPGGGRLVFGDKDGEYGMMFHIPRARVSGEVEFDGNRKKIQGTGFADHSFINLAPYNAIHRWFRFKVNSDKITIIAAEMEATKEYSNSRNGWIMLADENGVIANTTRISFDYDGFIRDTRSSEGYTIPRRVRIAAVDGNKHITGVLLMKRIKEIRDPLAKLDAFRRAAARFKTKPRDYYIECSYKLRVKTPESDRTWKGTHDYRFVYVNP